MSSQPPLGTGASLAALLAASGPGPDANRADFDILNLALTATGLDTVLAAPGADLTLFAPTDAAFLSLARSLGYRGNSEQGAFDAIAGALGTLAPGGDALALLADVLRYHLSPGAKTSAQIVSATAVPTLLTDTSFRPFGLSLQDADPDARDAVLLGPARIAGNGTLQAINEVLLPVDLPGNGDKLPALPSIAGLLDASGTGFDSNGGDFDILRTAVDAVGLDGALANLSASLTVFAPTDAAFLALARSFGFTGSSEQGAVTAILGALDSLDGAAGDGTGLLADILRYHVAPERLSRAQADAAGPIQTLLAGATIEVAGGRVIDADQGGPDARFVPGGTDILAVNGAVQAIDRVLLPVELDLPPPAPPTIADRILATGNGFDANRGDFDILKAALNAAGLTAALDDPHASLTLFAPTDAAFLLLARNLGYRGSSEAGAFDAIVDALTDLSPGGDPIPLLTEILTYHVATGELTAQDIARTTSITTLSGESISPFGLRLIDGDPTLPDAFVIGALADREASNGLIQTVNRVLLPLDVAESAGGKAPHGTLADLVAASGPRLDRFGGDFDILKAALGATGLTAALDDPAATLTLLAPTDAAFIRLARELGYRGNAEQGALDTILDALADLGGGNALPLLTDILEYHVIDGRFGRTQLQAAGELETLGGEALGFAGNRILDAETGYQVRFVPGGGNVLTANGALQAIDGVLLPTDLALI